MKKCIFVLTLLIFLVISGCHAPPVENAGSIPGAAGAEESDTSTPSNSPAPIPGQHTYEVRARLHESMPEYRFVATGIKRGTDEWAYGYVLGLNVYDENGKSILTADFSSITDGETVGYSVYNE